jgi:hypothetical protein
MSSPNDAPFDPRAFAAQIVPPKNPMSGYDARQAELAEKDHPWAERYAPDELPAEAVEAPETPVQDDIFANPYKDVKVVENPGQNTGVNNRWNEPVHPKELAKIRAARTPEEQAAQEARDHAGAAVAKATLQAAMAKIKKTNG